MVSCPAGSTLQPGKGDLITLAEAMIGLFGTKTPPQVWPFVGASEFSLWGISDICTAPPADLTFPTEQDYCDIGINFGGVVAGVCSTADPGRAAKRFAQWVQNQIFPQFCQCTPVAGASCGSFSQVFPSVHNAFGVHYPFGWIPKPAGASGINISSSATYPVVSPQGIWQTTFRIVRNIAGVLTYGPYSQVSLCNGCSGLSTGSTGTQTFAGTGSDTVGVEIGTFGSASTAAPVDLAQTITATFSGTCTQTLQNVTPGSGQNVPNYSPPAISTGCTTDTLCGKLDQVLWDLSILLNARPTASPSNIINLYPNYQAGTVHAGLTGHGTLTVANLLGLKVNVTAQPASLGSTGLAPTVYFTLGYITFGTVDGWMKPQKVLTDQELFLPIDPRVTRIDYDLTSGVTATLTELISV